MDADLPDVADFLHRHLNPDVAATTWLSAVHVPWKVDAPNHGFLLADHGEVVGAYLAFYCEREVSGERRKICNLGAWCVLADHRFQSLRLLRALLAQTGYLFTDLSPSGAVVPLNLKLGFRLLDTTTALVPNLPWPAIEGRTSVSCDPHVIEAALSGDAAELYHDHAQAAAAQHLILTQNDRTCYVLYRRDRRKGMPLFATLLYVQDPDVLRRSWRALSRHLLIHHAVPVTLAERRIAGAPPRWSRTLTASRPKMIRAEALEGDRLVELYSELTCVPW